LPWANAVPVHVSASATAKVSFFIYWFFPSCEDATLLLREQRRQEFRFATVGDGHSHAIKRRARAVRVQYFRVAPAPSVARDFADRAPSSVALAPSAFNTSASRPRRPSPETSPIAR
jgi:hypothetical protein